ncbi:MAG: hypothetical protein ACKPKO_65740 [Candidatus Fonsibacter sp.]
MKEMVAKHGCGYHLDNVQQKAVDHRVFGADVTVIVVYAHRGLQQDKSAFPGVDGHILQHIVGMRSWGKEGLDG